MRSLVRVISDAMQGRKYVQLTAALGLMFISRRHCTQMRILSCGYCVAFFVFWIVTRVGRPEERSGCCGKQRGAEWPKGMEGGREAGALSLWRREWVTVDPTGVCLPSGEAGKQKR